MFKDSRALDRSRTDASFRLALRRYADDRERWFDGSVGSVDRRLGACERLLHSVRATVARLAITDSHRYLRAADELEADRRVLQGMRDDLLTGASSREDVIGPPGWRLAKGHYAAGGAPTGPGSGTIPGNPNVGQNIPGQTGRGGTGLPPGAGIGGPFPQLSPQQAELPVGSRPPLRSAPLLGQGSPVEHESSHIAKGPSSGIFSINDPAYFETPDLAEHGLHEVLHAQPARGEDLETDFQRRTEEARGYAERTEPGGKHRKHRGPIPVSAALNGTERRWVTLESAKFLAANTDTLDDSHELATRADHYAAVKTSTFTPARSAILREAFVARVVDLGQASYRPPPIHRVAMTDPDIDPQALFL
jgi:hypothetical protein